MTGTIAQDQRLVERIARQIQRRLHLGHSDLADLIQDGMVGLLESQRRYQPQRGTCFEAFATPRIRGAILNGQSTLRRVGRACLRRVRDLDRAEERLRGQLQRNPSHAEIAGELHINLADLDIRLHERELAYTPLLPTIECIHSSESDAWVDRQPLAQALASLPERQQHILHLYYQVGLDMLAIARVLKLSQPRVSQLHHASLLAIQKFFQAHGQN